MAAGQAAPEVTLGLQLNGPLFLNPARNALTSFWTLNGSRAPGYSRSQGCPSSLHLYAPKVQLCVYTAPPRHHPNPQSEILHFLKVQQDLCGFKLASGKRTEAGRKERGLSWWQKSLVGWRAPQRRIGRDQLDKAHSTWRSGMLSCLAFAVQVVWAPVSWWNS